MHKIVTSFSQIKYRVITILWTQNKNCITYFHLRLSLRFMDRNTLLRWVLKSTKNIDTFLTLIVDKIFSFAQICQLSDTIYRMFFLEASFFFTYELFCSVPLISRKQIFVLAVHNDFLQFFVSALVFELCTILVRVHRFSGRFSLNFLINLFCVSVECFFKRVIKKILFYYKICGTYILNIY